jgi:hypothetical protein
MIKLLAIVVVVTLASGSSAYGQTPFGTPRTSASTLEQTSEGGWAGPCDPFWDSSDFTFNAMRACRVMTYLVRSWQPPLDLTAARDLANTLMRICWGTFPKARGNCSSPNAWAPPRGWIDAARQAQWRQRLGLHTAPPPPIVLTLRASELLQSDDEVAFLLAHEMGHAVDSEQTTSTNTASNEQRADVAAIGFLIRAGYDARSGGRSLQNLTLERGQGAFGNLLGTLSNHLDQALSQDVHGFTSDRIRLMKDVFGKGCVALNNKPLGCKEGWK